MEVQNTSNSILNINYPRNIKNKVYINPNFNRSQTNNVNSNATMHVNPKFSHIVSNSQSNITNKNKIYINPNFIKSRNNDDGYQCITTSVNNHAISDTKNPIIDSLTTNQQQSVRNEAMALPAPVAQSRYCLVRQNVINQPLSDTLQEKSHNTFKINKYKTVSWKEIKRNLDNVKNVANNNLTCFETNFQSPIIGKVSNSFRRKNEFKLINNHNNSSLLKQDKIKTKIYLDTHKKLFKPNQANQPRVKKMKGSLKKNNIPCPLFRKFGKCIRNVRGNCEFLHDKKHVSICRKFIKGLCHDEGCLLSHDLTTKKMPTCYFYLQGTCTKVNCPYLHVKLNEKTKICPDFLKGYCEKGSKCLQRHINTSTERKKQTSQMRDSFRKKHNDSKIRQSDTKNLIYQKYKVLQKIEKESENSDKSLLAKGENFSENRYYDEHQDDRSSNEYKTIKPMRCKLGTLPSFIQL